jgi:drug/metabolite transporter (DMT)-like permease
VSVPVDTTTSRPVRRELVSAVLVLAVAVVAISSSAVLVRWADADPVALAFWRTLCGGLILAPAAVRAGVRPSGAQWLWILVAGVALGAHFGTWLASVEMTSIAASVTLVSTAPLMVAVALTVTGRPLGRRTWLAIALGLIGAMIITLGPSSEPVVEPAPADGPLPGNPALGNALALIGAATMALYLVVGDHLRTGLTTAAYAARTYGVAAATTLAVALATGVELFGYDRATWLTIGAMVVGPQLAGHTALNYLLGRIGSVSVSLALLAEPLGAGLLAWLAFRELPPIAAVVGGPLVVAAVALRVLDQRSDRATPPLSHTAGTDRKGQG